MVIKKLPAGSINKMITGKNLILPFVIIALIAIAGCGPNSYGISHKSPQELLLVSNIDICHAQRFWKTSQLMDEIKRRNLNCNSVTKKQLTSPTTSGNREQSLVSSRMDKSDKLKPSQIVGEVNTLQANNTSKEISTFAGTWKGNVTQSRARRYPVIMTINSADNDSVSGQIHYPTLKCGGPLRLITAKKGHLVLYSEIQYGMNRCIDGGKIEIELGQNNLKWTWFYPNGRKGGYSNLSRSNVSQETEVNLSKSSDQPKTEAPNKPVVCGDTSFKNLTTDQGKGLKYLLERNRISPEIGCITELVATDKFPLRGQTVIKYQATVVFPNGYRTDCLTKKKVRNGEFQGFNAIFKELDCSDIGIAPAKVGETRIYSGEEII